VYRADVIQELPITHVKPSAALVVGKILVAHVVHDHFESGPFARSVVSERDRRRPFWPGRRWVDPAVTAVAAVRAATTNM